MSHTATMEPALLTHEQGMELTQLSRRTWFAAARSVPGRVCFGRVVRFQRAAVLAWIAEGCPLGRVK
jgi:predicted DNA-binding transcriptional regulator AlpA